MATGIVSLVAQRNSPSLSLGRCYGLNVCITLKFLLKSQIPMCWALGKYFRHEDGALINSIRALKRHVRCWCSGAYCYSVEWHYANRLLTVSELTPLQSIVHTSCGYFCLISPSS